MYRIWLKTLDKEKIIFSRVFSFEGAFKPSLLYPNLTVMCNESDIPVPMVLNRHTAHFARFNVLRFKPIDFVESVGFSSLVLEYVFEDKG